MSKKEITVDGVVYVQKCEQTKVRSGAWTIGTKYLIRTVTMTITGRLSFVDEHELVMEDGAWIPDTGRFSEAVKTGKVSEVEPFYGDVIIGRGSIVDACEWLHELPEVMK